VVLIALVAVFFGYLALVEHVPAAPDPCSGLVEPTFHACEQGVAEQIR